jgi:hypothetical protein
MDDRRATELSGENPFDSFESGHCGTAVITAPRTAGMADDATNKIGDGTPLN